MDEVKVRKHNMKLYPQYLMFGFDLLFFYGVRVIFYTETKGITSSQILLLAAIYAISMIVFQIPNTLITSKIGYKNSAILGNIFNIMWAIVVIFAKSFSSLAIAQLFSGMGFSLKYLSESNLLTSSIPSAQTYERNEIFTRIDKKGFSKYCILSAISTVASGVLYNVNPYIPIILCLICIIISTIISFNFADVEEDKSQNSFKDYLKELKKGYKFIRKSKRLRALLLMTGITWSIIVLLDTYQLTLLQDIGASSVQIGFIFATLELTKGLFSNRAQDFNKKYKNKSLTNILLAFAIGFILAGGTALLDINFETKLAIIVVILLVMGAANAIDQILAKRYVNSFTSTKILTAIYSAKAIYDNVLRTIVSFLGSMILAGYNIDVAMIGFGVIILIVTFLLSIYSNGKLGLKPDQYTQKDIYKR